MKERPIIMQAESVRAILDGRKTQTRRVVKPQPERVTEAKVTLVDAIDGSIQPLTRPDGWEWGPLYASDSSGFFAESLAWHCPYGAPGDRLWVRETWQAIHVSIDPETGHGDDVDAAERIPKDNSGGWWRAVYAATDPFADEHRDDRGFSWRSPLYMPRWASRLLLEVTGVRVERLQDISEEDARAEGVLPLYGERGSADVTSRATFELLWDDINGKRAPWASNCWVWVIEFRRVEAKEAAA